jgi:hypothetical protein
VIRTAGYEIESRGRLIKVSANCGDEERDKIPVDEWKERASERTVARYRQIFRFTREKEEKGRVSR